MRVQQQDGGYMARGQHTTTDRRQALPLGIVLVIILCTVAYVRIRLLQVPFERDEGEYAYMGQLMLKGVAPYANVSTMKLPGVSALYALFMLLFGQTVMGVHLGFMIVNGVSIALVYLLSERLLGRESALISCATYAVMSLSWSVLGVFAHATHFVVLFTLAGFVLLFRHLDSGGALPLATGGLCFGTAFLMKQHALLFLICAGAYLLWSYHTQRKGIRAAAAAGGWFLAGALVPYTVVLLLVLRAGIFPEFWFWTVQYAREYVAEMTAAQGWANFSLNFGTLVKYQLPFMVMAALGGSMLLLARCSDTGRVFIAGFLAVSCLAICPGWYFRPHYFILLLPAVALLAGGCAHPAAFIHTRPAVQTFRQVVLPLLLAAAFAFVCYKERKYLFLHTPRQVSRGCYALSPFPESVAIARYIRERTVPADRIAVLGSEPQIFFYADRLSATRHIYMYGLMENHPYAMAMQREMIAEVERARPEYIVMVNNEMSWYAQRPVYNGIMVWGVEYARDYDTAVTADIISNEETVWRWGDEAGRYPLTGRSSLVVLKRRGGAGSR